MTDRLTSRVLLFALVALGLLALYVPTLQIIPNGSDHYYMIDVGEIQIGLNVWGTLHATGYPHYSITGGLLVALLRAVGISPAAAPGVVSLLWTGAALAVMYVLALRLTSRSWVAAAVVLLFGLTRTVWIHADIAEIYSFGLTLLALLFLLALGPPVRGRVYWLALIGGIAVAHHRAFAMIIPALLLAVWSEVVHPRRRLPAKLAICLALGLLGFLPYLYLPLRALAGAAWVYGEPGTWSGFWDQFWGSEASHFIGSIESLDALLANAATINAVLVTDLTLAGLGLGLLGLGLGLMQRRTRKPALVFLLSGLLSYLFHVGVYTDILSPLILQVTFSLAFGWLFLLDAAVEAARRSGAAARLAVAGASLAVVAALAVTLVAENRPFIESLVTDTTGLQTIALAEAAPPGSTLMIAWGHHHFAVGFARDVLGELSDIQLVDHKADFRPPAARGTLVTPAFTFYNQPIAWWEERIGAPVWLSAVAPSLIRISLTPEHADVTALDAVDSAVECHGDAVWLRVTWASPETPTSDLSVFVHLLDAGGNVLAQADQSAPVYGWRPLTGWGPGEAIDDVYALPALAGAERVRYGLYRQLPDGAFENVLQHELPVNCPP